ncbi:alpha/beta-hydrolase [Trametes sanguinea]|nr:alpha/beta-hydrolase [Trametes sanguinea]
MLRNEYRDIAATVEDKAINGTKTTSKLQMHSHALCILDVPTRSVRPPGVRVRSAAFASPSILKPSIRVMQARPYMADFVSAYAMDEQPTTYATYLSNGIRWHYKIMIDACGMPSSAPVVTLDKATVIGTVQGPVTSYFGIPFAEPPGTINATQPATQCPQLIPSIRSDTPQNIVQDMLGYFSVDFETSDIPESEDCQYTFDIVVVESPVDRTSGLSISVQIPTGTKRGDKLPVLAFIFGGGFTFGSTAQNPGNSVIERSIELGQPIIYVSMNYRVGAFGFLGGKEIKEAGVGNLGLQDQRVALRWIKEHISAFGGDPDKVTIWGVSAGAISVASQMITNGGNNEGLFRGAIMNSGSPLPTGSIDSPSLQSAYDTVVEHAGCAGAADTLECLRTVSTETIMNASAVVPNLFDYPGVAEVWAPRADGVFFEAPSQHLVLAGSVAEVPFMTGDCLDEGTIFAIGSFNVTYLYPNDPAAGSPFGTGDANELAPQFKRMAAFQGDAVFQAPRRFFLDQRSSKQPAWSFISQRHAVTGLGYPHGSDFGPVLAGDDLTDYIIQFTATLDPNRGASNRTIAWPKYDPLERSVLELVDGEEGLKVGRDTARKSESKGTTESTQVSPDEIETEEREDRAREKDVHILRTANTPKRIRRVEQPPLRALQHVALVDEVVEHRAPLRDEVVEARVCIVCTELLDAPVRALMGVSNRMPHLYRGSIPVATLDNGPSSEADFSPFRSLSRSAWMEFVWRTPRLPAYSKSTRVTDADEEVFLLYTDLVARKAADGSSGFRGLGHIDSHEDVLTITLNIGVLETNVVEEREPPVKHKHVHGTYRKRTRKKHETEQTLEVHIHQDKTALRSRKGDTGSVVWHARIPTLRPTIRVSVDFAEAVLRQLYARNPAGLLDPDRLADAHIVELG